MKKIIIIFIVFVYSFSLNAQRSKIIGSWLVTKVEISGKIQQPYILKEYTKDGKMVMYGKEIGTWNYNRKRKEIVMKSVFDKDFNGTDKILILTDKELVVRKEGVKVTYLKLDLDKIYQENSSSKLEGTWKLENDFEELQLLKIELPNTCMFTQVSGGLTTTSKGTWMYNSKEKSLVFIGRFSLLKGKSILKEVSEDNFTLFKNGRKIVAKKETSSTKIARLTFSIDDFSPQPNENSPWTDFNSLLVELENVSYLKYKQRKLIANTKIFKEDILLSEIDLNLENKGVGFVNSIITKGDTIQYSESYKGGLLNMDNDFFPQNKIGPYRMVATETITVAAGKFKCKVFEGFDGPAKLKYWMVINKPGVYAKVIREDIGYFDKLEYSIIELEEIK